MTKSLTVAQNRLLEWFYRRGGDGIYDKKRRIIARGERGSFEPTTISGLKVQGYAEDYDGSSHVRLTARGSKLGENLARTNDLYRDDNDLDRHRARLDKDRFDVSESED